MTDFNEKDCDELYFEGIIVPDNQIQQFQSNGPFMKKITYSSVQANIFILMLEHFIKVSRFFIQT